MKKKKQLDQKKGPAKAKKAVDKKSKKEKDEGKIFNG